MHNAIVWTDTRSAELVRNLKRRLGSSELTALCGLPLSTYPSVAKLLWLLANVPKVKEAYDAGKLAFGTIDTWLVFRLNGGTARNVFVTDPTNASRTMFMNLESLTYDDQLLDFFRLDREKLHLPTIVRSSDTSAYGTLASTALKGTPITGCLGDQSAALVGQKGFTPGLAKNTYGTGCFLLYNVGPKPVISKHGLLTTVAFDFSNGQRMYALEGSIAVAGSSVKFLVDNLKFVESSRHVSKLAASVPDNGGVTFVTAFSGLYAPYWYDDARGTLFGLTAYTQQGHIARATLEATCFQTKAILDAMEKDSGHALSELAVDGGMCSSDLTMQVRIFSPMGSFSALLWFILYRRSFANYLCVSYEKKDPGRSHWHPGPQTGYAGDDCSGSSYSCWAGRWHMGKLQGLGEDQHGGRDDFQAAAAKGRKRFSVCSVAKGSENEQRVAVIVLRGVSGYKEIY